MFGSPVLRRLVDGFHMEGDEDGVTVQRTTPAKGTGEFRLGENETGFSL